MQACELEVLQAGLQFKVAAASGLDAMCFGMRRSLKQRLCGGWGNAARK